MNRNELTKRVNQAAVELLHVKGYIAPVDLFKKIGMLNETGYERWRRRQVPYLEKVLTGSLGRCSQICYNKRRSAVLAMHIRVLGDSYDGRFSWRSLTEVINND